MGRLLDCAVEAVKISLPCCVALPSTMEFPAPSGNVMKAAVGDGGNGNIVLALMVVVPA